MQTQTHVYANTLGVIEVVIALMAIINIIILFIKLLIKAVTLADVLSKYMSIIVTVSLLSGIFLLEISRSILAGGSINEAMHDTSVMLFILCFMTLIQAVGLYGKLKKGTATRFTLIKDGAFAFYLGIILTILSFFFVFPSSIFAECLGLIMVIYAIK